uniref:Protocadherin alpha subfamily C, 2 n=1 Tax=Tetraodon nigroviridis TaxID=99883 RepID=H3C3R9_TETNG
MGLKTGLCGKWQIMYCSVLCACLLDAVWGQIRYSIPEELEHGAFVGNIAEDLGLDADKLSARRFRIVSGGKRQYVEMNLENGVLFVNERIDREELCEQSLSCAFHLQVVIENPLELYRVELEILDVNDNSPSFPWTEFNLDISESAAPGSRFPLESAQDSDVGSNSLRTYLLSVNEHFLLDIQTRSDGSKFAELVLQTPLDREQQSAHQMVLTAVDGGAPERSGTAQIDITVLDANDNAPVFDQSFYRVRLAENAPKGTVVIKLNASDLDEGPNADITYSFSGHAPLKVRQLFSVDPRTGEIKVKGVIDYEKARMHEIYVQAKDKGPSAVAVHCKVLVNVLDKNDNIPDVILTSVSTPVQEDAPPGTVIAVISVTDKDSGENGNVDCEISHHVPFQLHSSFKNYYTLVTSDFLDRESVAEYNITLTARDMGSPPLFTRKTILVQVADVNDNAPRFKQPSYTVYLTENNAPGASICAVTALDPDSGQNAYISYSVHEGDIQGMPVSTYVSINSDNGNIYALRSFDHEQLKNFQITVQAQDAGLPPLSNNVSIVIFVLDQNDNPPVIVSPVSRNGTAPDQAVPRSADAGHLVTKVRAVDADAGQNSRLLYQMIQATDPTLFSVALYTGEVRTIRQLVEKDPTRHRLVILVKDNGQPALSATVSISLSVVDSLPESKPETTELPLEYDVFTDLNLYLVIGLGAVSFLLLITILVIIVLKCCKGHRFDSKLGAAQSELMPSHPSASFIISYTPERVRQMFSMDTNTGEIRIVLSSLSSPVREDARADTVVALISVTDRDSGTNKQQPKAPNADWRYSASLRAAGVQSSVHMEEASVMQGAQGMLVQNWPTVSSAAGVDGEGGGELSPPVGAGVNSNSWNFRYGAAQAYYPPQPLKPGEIPPEAFIIPGSPAIISIRHDAGPVDDKGEFISFGKKDEAVNLLTSQYQSKTHKKQKSKAKTE